METLVQRILAQYGFLDVRLLAPGKGYRNHSFPAELPDGRRINLMLYKREPEMLQRIKRANAVANFTAAQGLPARHTFDERIMRLTSARDERYAALYAYLLGTTIPWEAYTRRHIKLLGKTMSDLHAALQGFDAPDLPDVADEYLTIVARMQQYFAEPGVHSALQAKLNLTPPDLRRFPALLKGCKRLSNQQALHMDFVRGNILFSESSGTPEISGIIDFEKTAHGHPLFDVARTLAFLLVDCKFKSEADIRKSFLHSGYQKRGTANLLHVRIKTAAGLTDLLEELVSLFLIYDFYKFLCHNPYESLPQNEHFVRTRDLLKARGELVEVP